MLENDPEPGDLMIAVRISLTGNLTSWSVSSLRSGPELTSHGMCLWGKCRKSVVLSGQGDLVLNSLLVASLSLKLPRSYGGPKGRDD